MGREPQIATRHVGEGENKDISGIGEEKKHICAGQELTAVEQIPTHSTQIL